MSGRPAVLVTGGAGYIGSHACKALAAAGFLPVAYDNMTSGRASAVRWGPLEKGDIRDRAKLDAVIARYKPIAALHFAGRIEAGLSVREPLSFYQDNVCGTLTLLQAMQQAGIRLCIFSSSAAVYGAPAVIPVPETAALNPTNPYGATKLVAERMLADFSAAHQSRFAALRYFNAAGADPDGEIGETHDPETHLIPLILQVASGRRSEIVVYGTDYGTPDGTCIRDYVHVCDLAEAHVTALTYLIGGGASCALNLGLGTGYSVQQIIDSTIRVTGRAIRVSKAERREGDPPILVADPSAARQVLGWTPQRTEIETILGDAWRWEKHISARLAEMENS